jgi:2,4-dienoyl-CoA reductase-like NADH-dependent reductase (Old Yellow Enzyme family)
MKNRFMLAPMTNTQSHEDGTLSDEEYRWLTMRAKGDFGLTMTCAAHVQAGGQGFPGQLGIFSETHVPGLSRLASGIKAEDSVAIVQLFHAGTRSPASLIGTSPVGPSKDSKSGARELGEKEVQQLVEDFIEAAVRADRAGFDGVELHGAHGYVICQFLSPESNRRTDQYGGSLDNRVRLLLEIISAVRERCRPNFIVGVRLSPERFGLQLSEMIQLARRLLSEQKIDFLDLSLWDAFKEAEEPAFRGRNLLSWFTELDRGPVRLAVAGKIQTPSDARRAMEMGVDAILL